MTRKYPRPISTTVCLTTSPSNIWAAPAVMLISPEVTAASLSAWSRGRWAEIATSSPSEETTTACATPGTRSANAFTSQLRSRASWLNVIIIVPLRCDRRRAA